MDLDKIRKKLTKLLALASSPNEAEADAAMAKCKELMTKYNIHTVDVDEVTKEVDVGGIHIETYSSKKTAWETKLAFVVATTFDGKAVILSKTGGNCVLTFIAGASDVIIIKDLYVRLRRIISKMGNVYAQTTEGNTITLANNYRLGIIEKIRLRLTALYKDLPDTMALVPVKKSAVEKTMMDIFGGDIGEHHWKEEVSNKKAYMQGYTDGDHLCLGQSIEAKTDPLRQVQG